MVKPLEQRLSHAAERTRDTLEAVIDQVPVAVKKPAEFQRVLKLDRSLSSRLLRAVQLNDPLASLHRMPGPHGIRLLLNAARKKQVDEKLIARAARALEELENLVTTEIGDWQDLSTAITGWLPDAREPFDMGNRQIAFKAMSNIKGITAGAEIAVTFIHPSRDGGDWVDRAGITGLCGLRRLRPGTPMVVMHGHSIAPPPGAQRTSLLGEPIDPAHGPALIREFTSRPSPKFDVQVEGDYFFYVLRGDGVGLHSKVDMFFGDVTRKRYPACREVSAQPATPGAVVDIPVRALIVDVLVHEDVWPGVEPDLRMYDTSGRGVANPMDPFREMDRIDVQESVQGMGTNVSRFRTKEFAQYVDMVRFVCKKLGWDTDRFRGYRCRLTYPVYGTEVSMVFAPPARDGQNGRFGRNR